MVDTDLSIGVRTLDPVVVPASVVCFDSPADRRILEMVTKLVMQAWLTANPPVIVVLPLAILQAQRPIAPALAKFRPAMHAFLRRYQERRDKV